MLAAVTIAAVESDGAAEQTFPRKNPAGALFDYKGYDRHRVDEQLFLLPDEEIMTVLTLRQRAILRSRQREIADGQNPI